jgi:uncharacterized protein (DUF1697 family)
MFLSSRGDLMPLETIPPYRHVALLRGINVGASARVSMAQLREVFSDAGYRNIVTILQSGNVVFDAPHPLDDAAVVPLEAAIAEHTGVSPTVVVLTAAQFRTIAEQNPLTDRPDPSRIVVTFTRTLPIDQSVELPAEESIRPEEIVRGDLALYQWCPDGILSSRVPSRVLMQVGPVITARNWRTVTRILAVL